MRRARRQSTTGGSATRRRATVTLAAFAVSATAAAHHSISAMYDSANRRTFEAEIAERMTPTWPRLKSPDRSDTSIAVLQAKLNADAAGAQPLRAYVPGAGLPKPRNAADLAWSEFNHNWAGFLVLAIGVLALAYRTGRADWAKHWPLLFLVLAVFLFVRSDPKYWPLGDINWFEGLRDTEAVQHRLAILLIVGFALFEWGVRTGRLTKPAFTYVFPIGAAIGATMLMTHTHALANVKIGRAHV